LTRLSPAYLADAAAASLQASWIRIGQDTAKLRPPLPAEMVYKAAKRTVFIAGATLRVLCGAEAFWFESPFQKRTKLISSLDIEPVTYHGQ